MSSKDQESKDYFKFDPSKNVLTPVPCWCRGQDVLPPITSLRFPNQFVNTTSLIDNLTNSKNNEVKETDLVQINSNLSKNKIKISESENISETNHDVDKLDNIYKKSPESKTYEKTKFHQTKVSPLFRDSKETILKKKLTISNSKEDKKDSLATSKTSSSTNYISDNEHDLKTTSSSMFLKPEDNSTTLITTDLSSSTSKTKEIIYILLEDLPPNLSKDNLHYYLISLGDIVNIRMLPEKRIAKVHLRVDDRKFVLETLNQTTIEADHPDPIKARLID